MSPGNHECVATGRVPLVEESDRVLVLVHTPGWQRAFDDLAEGAIHGMRIPIWSWTGQRLFSESCWSARFCASKDSDLRAKDSVLRAKDFPPGAGGWGPSREPFRTPPRRFRALRAGAK